MICLNFCEKEYSDLYIFYKVDRINKLIFYKKNYFDTKKKKILKIIFNKYIIKNIDAKKINLYSVFKKLNFLKILSKKITFLSDGSKDSTIGKIRLKLKLSNMTKTIIRKISMMRFFL